MKIIKSLKNISPYLFLLIFCYLIYNFYQNNKEDFFFLKNISKELILIVFFLCFFYLLIEGIIFKKIVSFFNKKISLNKCFLIMCATYLFNTFIQLSGLGFRAYFLKKKKKIDYSKFLIASIFAIITEFFIFSLTSLILLFIVLYIKPHSIDLKIFSVLFFVLLSSTVAILFNRKIFFLLNKKLNLKKFKIFKFFYDFYSLYNEKKIIKFFYSLLIPYLFSFLALFSIFLIGFIILEKDYLVLSSILATVFTDFSFLFIVTPYGIGVNEFFLYLGSFNLDLKIAEILFLTNLFRISMFCIYFFLGLGYTFFFLRDVKNNK